MTRERIRDALLVLAIVAALTAAAALVEAHHTEQTVANDRQARALANYAQCVAGRTSTMRINRLLESIRSDYLERAADATQLASLPGTSPAARAIRMASAERLRIRASTVFLFPIPRLKDCAETRDRELAR